MRYPKHVASKVGTVKGKKAKGVRSSTNPSQTKLTMKVKRGKM